MATGCGRARPGSMRRLGPDHLSNGYSNWAIGSVRSVDPPAARPLQLGDFDRVDTTEDPTRYVEWMRSQVRPRRDREFEALAVGPDDVVLDVGSGPGIELRALAAAASLAVGVDLSVTMTAASAAHAPGASVACADAQHLPFADGAFDACRARAVLVHTPHPGRAVAEMARCLKPGGRLVLSEPDQGTHIVATGVSGQIDDVSERVRQHRRTKFRNPLIGRALPELVVDAGLTVVKTWATPILYPTLETARSAGGPFDRAVADAVSDGAITAAEGDAYIDALVEADRRGHFVFAALALSVAAVQSSASMV
jgi:SAM-dependent methyltransferase